jgi:hypothetical protein
MLGLCARHRLIEQGLNDLLRRKVISATTHQSACHGNAAECQYTIKERDADGNCVMRHP